MPTSSKLATCPSGVTQCVCQQSPQLCFSITVGPTLQGFKKITLTKGEQSLTTVKVIYTSPEVQRPKVLLTGMHSVISPFMMVLLK